jgi:hypothetical protein
MTTPAPAPAPEAQTKEFARPINEIVADLSKPIPARFLKSKKAGTADVTFIPWHHATKLLDFYAPGWEYSLRFEHIAEKVVAIASLSIHAKEGVITREASGFEDDDVDKFGDPFSNSSSMALRRAAAHFGLGRHLYEGNHK